MKEALTAWNSKQEVSAPISAPFLDGWHPIVDMYELKTRLGHFLKRLTILERASKTELPTQIMEGLFLGGFLSSNSQHVLRYLRISSILNVTTVMGTSLLRHYIGFQGSGFPGR